MGKRVWWGLGAAFLAALVYLVFYHVDERDKRLTGDAVATVYDSRRSGKSKRLQYRYTVAGKAYEGTELTTNFSVGVGRPARACYDPRDPSQSKLKPMSSTCGSGKG